jgi:hypothetical protein
MTQRNMSKVSKVSNKLLSRMVIMGVTRGGNRDA